MAFRKKGFVALLDILGFSDRVARDSEVSGLDDYIDTVVSVTQGFQSIGVVLFSDTVALYTFDDTDQAFDDVIEVCSRLFYALLEQKIPLRGAISHGSFVRSENRQHGTVIAGMPIIEAHRYEAELQWVGIILSPSVLRKITDLERRTALPQATGEQAETQRALNRKAARIQWCESIPVNEGPLVGYAVVPLPEDAIPPGHLRMRLERCRRSLEQLKLVAPDPKSQRKYTNTITWFGSLEMKWLDARV